MPPTPVDRRTDGFGNTSGDGDNTSGGGSGGGGGASRSTRAEEEPASQATASMSSNSPSPSAPMHFHPLPLASPAVCEGATTSPVAMHGDGCAAMLTELVFLVHFRNFSASQALAGVLDDMVAYSSALPLPLHGGNGSWDPSRLCGVGYQLSYSYASPGGVATFSDGAGGGEGEKSVKSNVLFFILAAAANAVVTIGLLCYLLLERREVRGMSTQTSVDRCTGSNSAVVSVSMISRGGGHPRKAAGLALVANNEGKND